MPLIHSLIKIIHLPLTPSFPAALLLHQLIYDLPILYKPDFQILYLGSYTYKNIYYNFICNLCAQLSWLQEKVGQLQVQICPRYSYLCTLVRVNCKVPINVHLPVIVHDHVIFWLPVYFYITEICWCQPSDPLKCFRPARGFHGILTLIL